MQLRSRSRRTLAAILLIGSGCNGPSCSPPPVAPEPSRPVEQELPKSDVKPSKQVEPPPILPDDSEEETNRWLHVRSIREGAQGGVAVGSFDPARNKLDIRTQDVTRFSIDTGPIAIDWTRPVVLAIDGAHSELKKRKMSVLLFQLDDRGQWVIAE